MVGMAILSMLLGGIFWVYSSGANAWGKADDERATFFVGVSRAKRRLLATAAEHRVKPAAANYRWKTNRTPNGEYLTYIAAGI